MLSAHIRLLFGCNLLRSMLHFLQTVNADVESDI